MFGFRIVLGLCAALWVLVSPASGKDFPRGEIIDSVSTAIDPEQSYALYLPSNYSAERTWPLLLVFDARGRGARTAEFFRRGAERYGYILASSNNSASDAGWEPMQKSATALFDDLPKRFRVHPRRIYMAGFSGTSRAVAGIAHGLPEVAGVIAASGALAPETVPEAGLPFACFATAGTGDFNFWETQHLDFHLQERGITARFEGFDGGHTWPPEEIAFEALGWMELRAMAEDLRPIDQDLVAELEEDWTQDAEALESKGDLLGAYLRYRELHADFEGLADTSDLAAAVQRLAKQKQVTEGLAETRRVASWEAARQREMDVLYTRLVQYDTQPGPTFLSEGRRYIQHLQRVVRKSDSPEEADAARRVLALIATRTSFYYPRELLGKGEYARAVTSLRLATEIRPNDVRAWYNLACAQARLGRKKPAYEALERAVASGFSNADHLRNDEDLKSLRGEKRFEALLGSLE
ncbi:MAG: tetratricopeptide repeat protein [Acidobacteriota bacterium]